MTFASKSGSAFRKGMICLFLLAILHSQGWAQIGPPPVITAQPLDTNVVYGGTASFFVTAASATALSYQWYKAGLLPIFDQPLTGQTRTNLVLTNVGDTDAGQYYVTVNNASGTVVSSQAALTVFGNTPPVASNDTYTMRENVGLAVPAPGILTNDTDVNGQALIALLMTNVSHGSLSLNTNGSFTYTPNTNYFGSDSFAYRASDGYPVQLEQNNSGGSAFRLDDGETGAQSFRHGSAGGSSYWLSKIVVYISRENKVQSGSLNFSVGTGVNSGTIAGSARAIPQASITNTTSGASYQTFEFVYSSPLGPFTAGTTYFLNLANQTGKKVYVEHFNNVSSYANGTFYYNGSDQGEDLRFQTYETILSNPATVTINVNDPPVAVNDTTNTLEDTSVTIKVLANDSDLQGTPLLLAGASTTNGTAVINGTNIVFTPSTNFNGTTVFNYTVSDGSLYATGMVTVAVTPVNDPPVSFNDSYTTLEDVSLTIPAAGILTNDVDVEGDALAAVLVGNVSQGSLSLNASGGFTYTPNANFNGSDSFTYRASDGSSTGNVATVTINVTPVNDPPTASNDTYTTLEDVPLTIAAPGVLTNDTDVDGNTLKALLSSNVAHGTLNLNTNGGFTYTPATNYSGSDSFTYRASDGFSTGNVATVTINVTPVNDGSPVANDDVYSTLEDVTLNVSAPGVLLNDTDVDGDTLTATLLSDVSSGSLSLNANGSFTYTPNTNYNGSDSFTYRVSDGLNPVGGGLQQNTTGGNKIEVKTGKGGAQSFRQGNAGGAAYTISKIVLYVSREPALPAANPAFSIGTNINSGAVAGSTVTIPASSITNTTSGASFQTYVINYSTPLGPFTAGTTYYLNVTNSTDKHLYVEYANANTYTNGTYYADGVNQNKDMRFQVFGFSDIAIVTINITPVTDAPIAKNAAYTASENVLLSVPPSGVLANVTNVENAPLSASLVATVSHGILNLNTNGAFTYKPNSNYFGSDSFTYRASVLSTTSAVATISLTVRDTQTPLSFVSSERTTNGMSLHLSEPGGYECVVEASTNLVDWIPFFTNAGVAGVVMLVDNMSTNIPARFYRAMAR